MSIVRLTKAGEHRVLEGKAGMIFIVLAVGGVGDRCRHVIDYRYSDTTQDYAIWTLGEGDYEEINA
jgi:hypothetical protein